MLSFVDIAGIVKGASEGEGLDNKFLANNREADAIAQVAPAQAAFLNAKAESELVDLEPEEALEPLQSTTRWSTVTSWSSALTSSVIDAFRYTLSAW